MAVIRGFATRIAMRRWLVERARAGFNAARWAVAIGALTVVADGVLHARSADDIASQQTINRFVIHRHCLLHRRGHGNRHQAGQSIVAVDPAVLRMGSGSG